MGEKKIFDKILFKITNLIYSKEKKVERWLILLLIMGFILRAISALNLDVLADDMLYASQSANILNAKILSTHSNPPLFFYLTDLAYKLLGHSTFVSRLWPIIFGTLSILVVFLITKKLFNQKVALLSAFFATFSMFLIRNSFTEMSLVWLFFNFFAIYLGILFLETRKNKFLVFSAILFGLAILTKYNAVFFILSFLIYSFLYIYSKKEEVFTAKNLRLLFLFLAIIFIFSLPFLAFNYLIYKDSQILDVYFSRMIQTERTQQLYGSLAGQGQTFLDNLFSSESYIQFLIPYYTDLIILLFAFIGFILLIQEKKYLHLWFLAIFLIIPFILQSAGSNLAKHFVFLPFLLSIPAGFSVYSLFNGIDKKNVRIFLILVIFGLMLFNVGNNSNTPQHFLKPSASSQLKSYLDTNVKENDLIVFDSRIYTARAFWFATPNHFLDNFRFIELNNRHLNISNEFRIPVDVYFVECLIDDCGWGTIKNQQELNKSVEDFFKVISQLSDPGKIIKEANYVGNEFLNGKTEKEIYKIYKQNAAFVPLALEQVDSVNSFYFTPYLYKDMSNYIYNYEIKSLPDRLLEKFSYWIILFSMFLSFISIIFVFYFLFNDKRDDSI